MIDHPVCARFGTGTFFLLAQPPLLTRRGKCPGLPLSGLLRQSRPYSSWPQVEADLDIKLDGNGCAFELARLEAPLLYGIDGVAIQFGIETS